MKKLQVAIIGLGRLGSACAQELLDEDAMALCGIVRRVESMGPLPGRLRHMPVAGHVRDLPAIDVALVCVPANTVLGVSRELLQARVPIVECAAIEGAALAAHYAELDDVARKHRTAAVVGAGWDPGVLQLFTRAFEMLIPRGQNELHRHPGIRLHHSAAVAHIPGVKGALAGQFRGANGAMQRYVYVEIRDGTDFAQVRATIADDPLFADEETQVFQVDSLSSLEAEEGQGMALERRSSPASGVHASLLLEARFELTALTARVMLHAARRIPALPHGAHRFSLGI
ncbi:oxidoreductase [Noviherbaspirillum sedimenti]|nr:oxidoreductase [Noviherbaspirillum sedimenti]